MGGFEGGDEGGFWDIDMLDKQSVSTSKHAKKATYHIERSGSVYSIKAYAKTTKSLNELNDTLLPHVIHIQEQYDTISFVPSECETFTIESPDEIPIKESSIYRAYQALIDYTADTDIEEFFHQHKVAVTRGNASSAALVSNSSHAAAFILLVKELCNLILRNDELAKIGNIIDSDVSFFINNYL
jgi:4-diphosphocytidyl-2-C-methyl-D-erythritol kinase